MQFTKTALAAAALCAAAAATAAPNANRIALSAGASAIQGNITLAVRNLCTAAGGVPTTISGGSNFTTVVCANTAVVPGAGNSYVTKPNSDFINFAPGLPFAEIRFNVANGSFGSVQILNGTAFTFRDPATDTNTAPPSGAVIIGGVSDVETTRFPATTIGANTLFTNVKLGAAQTFGVAASNALYTAMFNAQQAAGQIPPTCSVNDTGLSYCIPSISKAQMATIMANNEFNAAYTKGLGFLTGAAADEGVELRYLRRVNTSGTQAAAQNYFLGLTCSLNSLSVVDEPTSVDPTGFSTFPNALIGAIRVFGLGGTGDVRTELNKLDLDPGAAVVPNYALGVMSGENNQTSQNWRWLRVDGAPIGENAIPGTAGNTNSNTLRDGRYSFYFELTYTANNATNLGYWSTIANAVRSISAPVGLVNQATLDAGYNKGGLTCLGSSSN